MTATVAVTFRLREPERAVIAAALDGAAEAVYLTDLDAEGRARALRQASALLARDIGRDLHPHEAALIPPACLVQFITAGIDFVKLHQLPEGVPVAGNGGAYAEPMAEHGLAMTLAAAKRLLIQHAALARGEFNQNALNRTLAGLVCGIVGFGGIGEAIARLMRGLGMRVHAINRRGRSDQPADWFGTMADLDTLLTAADVLVLSLPLTPATSGMIGARELGLMRPNAW